MPLGVEIPLKEVKRYMGYHGIADISSDTEERIRKAVDQVSSQSHPRIVSKEYPVTVSDDEIVIHAGNEELVLHSTALARNLKDCCGAVLLAATIGPACDMLVRRAGVTSAADASIYQAAGAAAIESFLDDYNDRLKAEYEAQGLFLRPRFSPGYGDLDLGHQKDWFRLLDISKQIGIELTDSLLMVPTKSVTAIIGVGISENRTACTGCAGCNRHATCEFSKGSNET